MYQEYKVVTGGTHALFYRVLIIDMFYTIS